MGPAALKTQEMNGPPSAFVCPGCGGALWEIKQDKILRFRCHVGHGYTAESLHSIQTHEVEQALWTALRALEENAALRRRMADRVKQGKLHTMAERFQEEARDAAERRAV